VIKFTFFSS